jgi:hypothetical protein
VDERHSASKIKGCVAKLESIVSHKRSARKAKKSLRKRRLHSPKVNMPFHNSGPLMMEKLNVENCARFSNHTRIFNSLL